MYEIALGKGQEMPAIRIDGPYGAPAEDVFDNEIAILIGTGIGVTPWASILKNIWHIRASPNPTETLEAGGVHLGLPGTLLPSNGSRRFCPASKHNLRPPPKASGAAPEFLRIHTYLTQRLDVDQAANIYLNSVGTDVDPLTELKTRTNFGRPDFKRLFGAMRDGIADGSYMDGMKQVSSEHKKGRTEVGVYFCGPNAAAKDIKKAASTASGKDVKFKFWKERF